MTHFATLTDKQIQNLRPKAKPYKVFDGQGLYLEIMPSGSMKWRFRYIADGKDKRISFGGYPIVSLKEARIQAEEYRASVAKGNDPIFDRKYRVDDDRLTFAQLAEEWCHRQLETQALRTQRKKREHLKNYILPAIGNLPVNEITPALLLKNLLRKVEDRRHFETAHRIKMLCGQIFRYGIRTERADRDPTQDLAGALTPVPTTHRATIIEPVRIGQLLKAIDLYNGHVVVRYALKLTPLFFVRPGELRHAEWAEIKWDEALWRIPAEKMKKVKSQIPHLVPLSDQSISFLRELHTVTGKARWLFPGQRTNDRPISDMAVNVALKALGFGDEITAHGFRAMASTILNEQGYNRDWIERQLAHTERDGIRAAYNYAEYLPERRQMMQDWADYLEGLKN